MSMGPTEQKPVSPNKQAKCRKPSNSLSKKELRENHKARQAMKAAGRAQQATLDARRRYRIVANLGRNHPNYGKPPAEAYTG